VPKVLWLSRTTY